MYACSPFMKETVNKIDTQDHIKGQRWKLGLTDHHDQGWNARQLPDDKVLFLHLEFQDTFGPVGTLKLRLEATVG